MVAEARLRISVFVGSGMRTARISRGETVLSSTDRAFRIFDSSREEAMCRIFLAWEGRKTGSETTPSERTALRVSIGMVNPRNRLVSLAEGAETPRRMSRAEEQ